MRIAHEKTGPDVDGETSAKEECSRLHGDGEWVVGKTVKGFVDE